MWQWRHKAILPQCNLLIFPPLIINHSIFGVIFDLFTVESTMVTVHYSYYSFIILMFFKMTGFMMNKFFFIKFCTNTVVESLLHIVSA